MTTTATVDRSFNVAGTTERFYVRMAATFLIVGFVGFVPTYWLPLVRGTLVIPPLAHVHALFFYGWLLLFWSQTSLAASGRLARHREMGVLGVALATGMVFVGLGTAATSIKALDAVGFGEAGRRFSIVPITAAALFATMFAVALLNVRRPEVHKRVLLAATAALLQAPAGRWVALLLAPPQPGGGPRMPPPVAVSVIPGLLIDLLIVAAMIHDKRTTGRIHRTYWIWGAAIVAVQVLRVPVSQTDAWMHVPTWLMALVP
jgi:hypothetical protein